MSEIVKTPAIVLRYSPVYNTSRVVQWLTRDHGRIATMIKGSQRDKSAFIGQYDLFYTCELLFYASEHRDLHPAKEITPIRLRRPFAHKWRAAACASYYCDLVYRVCPPHAPASDIFHLLNRALDLICAHSGSKAHLFRFELQLLNLLGLRPQLTQCAQCERPSSAPVEKPLSFAKGGLLCPSCLTPNDTVERVAPDVLEVLSAWQEQPEEEGGEPGLSAEQEASIERLLGRFLHYHLEQQFYSREIALDILSRKQPPHVQATA